MSVPKLRFKEFDGDWEVNSIQHFMNINFILDQMDGNHGELYPKSEEFSSSGVPYVSATDFSSGIIDFSKCKRLPLERAKLFKKGIAQNGDVLFAHNATVGPVAILETELDFVVLSTTATYYRCNGSYLNNNYLKNYFESVFFVQQYFGIMSQSTRNQVPITTQRKLNIAIPSKAEQTKIASFLSAVDEKIQQLNQKQELLNQYKQGMMQKLFSQQIRFKADDGSEFGEWEGVTLDNISSHISGTALENYVDEFGDYNFISIGNYSTKGKYIDNSQRIILNEKTATKLLNKDDLVMVLNDKTASGDLIGSTILVEENNKYIYNQRSERIICNIRKVYPKYLWQFLNSEIMRSEVRKLAQGGTQIYINFSSVLSISFLLPCLEEQTKIANFLSAIDQKIAVVAEQIEQAKQWKKGLLQQMFV